MLSFGASLFGADVKEATIYGMARKKTLQSLQRLAYAATHVREESCTVRQE
jgi:hypothetical protein